MSDVELRLEALRLAMSWTACATRSGDTIAKAKEFYAFLKGEK